MKTYALTHRGLVRRENQDRFLVKEFPGAVLVALADGMGGHAGGEIAAQTAVDALEGFDPESSECLDALMEKIRAADLAVKKVAMEDSSLKSMGTTLTAAFVRDLTAHWVHVGDSRLYLLRQGHFIQITDDHTLPGFLLKEGEISREEARVHPLRNALLSCIGCGKLEGEGGTLDLEAGDLLLLSSDGLHDGVPEEAIADILNSKHRIEEKLDALVDAALSAGGRDNITVVGVQMSFHRGEHHSRKRAG